MTRRKGWLLAQTLVTVLLLAVLLRSLDLASFRALFARLPAWFYLTSLAVVLLGQVAYAWRWRLLLVAGGVDVVFSVVVRQYFIGIFVNNFLPSTVGGDLAKVYLLGRDHGYRVVTASVLMDRALGIGLLAIIASAALWAVPLTSAALVAARLGVTVIAVAAVTILVVTAAGTGGLPQRVAPLGVRAVALAQALQRLRVDMAAPLRSPVVLCQAVAVVACYLLAVAVTYVEFLSLQHVTTPSLPLVFGVVTATAVLSNIPISLNGLGLREQLHAVLLAPLGVPPEMAVAISLLLYGHLVIASVIGLVFWLQSPVVAKDLAAPLET